LQVGVCIDSRFRPAQVILTLDSIVLDYVNSYLHERHSFLEEDTVLCQDIGIGEQDMDGFLFVPVSRITYFWVMNSLLKLTWLPCLLGESQIEEHTL